MYELEHFNILVPLSLFVADVLLVSRENLRAMAAFQGAWLVLIAHECITFAVQGCPWICVFYAALFAAMAVRMRSILDEA